jgi:6-pyruvoyl-tetrahydropterin synthase related domain
MNSSSWAGLGVRERSRLRIRLLPGATDVVANWGSRLLLQGSRLVVIAFWLVLLGSSLAHASPVSLQGRATLSASPDRLSGEITLTLSADEAIYNASVALIESGATHVLGSVSPWLPRSEQHFSLSVPAGHAFPGDYHVLVQVDFQDQAGAWLSVALGFPYRVVSSRPAVHVPSVTFLRDRVEWHLNGLAPDAVKLDLTSGPAWRLAHAPLSAGDGRLAFTPVKSRPARPDATYPQLARLRWVEAGIHHSVLVPWTLQTDAYGHWNASTPGAAAGTLWREAGVLWAVALVLVVLAILVGGLRFRFASGVGTGLAPDPLVRRLFGWLMVMLSVGWMASHTRLDLWLTPTWPTGGDIASHVFYANVFAGWLGQGKISGWLPESFAGFPAFSYYFPFPFILIGLLSHLVGIQPAIKVVAMLPAFLLPLATYLMGTLLRWPVAVRVLGAAGAGGFILGEANSIWGGNVLSELSGEFAYGWGMAAVVCFWGILAHSLRCGGRWWILASVVEALAALCHGYALLMAGFGAFVVWLVYGGGWRSLRAVLQVHLLAFLLIGFWLLPLFETAPWTIPNDTAFVLKDWHFLWPAALSPLALVLPLVPLAFRYIPESRSSFAMLAGLGLLGFLGFVAAPRLGLADIRFFPYAQWAAAVLLGAAPGWALVAWNRAPLWWSAALSAALVAWWQPRISTMEHWARWNLEGYESKAMWPVYKELAATLKGPLDAPRVVFEHDPENSDLGSTRTLEALPLFGSRPVLEGLYMESAVSGPFIYQLQAEVSERPSSPLARYPSRKGSPREAEQHMRELYTDKGYPISSTSGNILG